MPAITRFLARRGAKRVIPWYTYLEVARTVVQRGHAGYSALTPQERGELQRVLRASKGRPGAVPEADRRLVRQLVTKAAKGAARGRKR